MYLNAYMKWHKLSLKCILAVYLHAQTTTKTKHEFFFYIY